MASVVVIASEYLLVTANWWLESRCCEVGDERLARRHYTAFSRSHVVYKRYASLSLRMLMGIG